MSAQQHPTAIQRRESIDSGDTTIDSLFRLADELLPSGMLPDHLQNSGAVVAVILAGRELGLGPMASIRSIHLVKGKVVIDAAAQLALLHRAGIRSRWREKTGSVAALELSRNGHDWRVFSYTIEQARIAGLIGSPVWKKHPGAMLRARCVSSAARAYAPEILMGCYTPGEAAEIDPGRYPAIEYTDGPQTAPNGPETIETEPIAEGAPEPEPEHHKSWEADRPGFCARLRDRDWKYDELCAFIQWKGGNKRPSAMTDGQRALMLARLADPDPDLRASIALWISESEPEPEPEPEF